MPDVHNIHSGKAQGSSNAQSQTSDARQGTKPGSTGQPPIERAAASRSTGINAEQEAPIDPRMPNLSPA